MKLPALPAFDVNLLTQKSGCLERKVKPLGIKYLERLPWGGLRIKRSCPDKSGQLLLTGIELFFNP